MKQVIVKNREVIELNENITKLLRLCDPSFSVGGVSSRDDLLETQAEQLESFKGDEIDSDQLFADLGILTKITGHLEDRILNLSGGTKATSKNIS